MSDTRRMRANTGNRIALGVLILLVALFIFICTCGAFGGVGDMVSSVFVGFFGLADYAYSLVAATAGVAVIFNFKVKASPSRIVKLALMFFCGVWALNVYSSSGHIAGNDYGGYLVACYEGANTAGGMLFGIISYPLMKIITTVGALVVVCVLFFVLAFIALFPTVRKDITYVTAAEVPKNRRAKGARIDRQKAPVITDFSSPDGGSSLYVVDVEGDPLSKAGRRNKGASGYDPLYPNSNARYEDELRSGGEQPRRTDRFSTRSLAKDILFNPEPAEESFSAYRTITNPDEALSNPSAPYSAMRRNELKRRLGVDDTGSMARDIVRERYFGEEKPRGAQDDKDDGRTGNVIDPNARGASALGYSSFDELKADRMKQFGQMFGTQSDAPEKSSGGYGPAPSSGYGASATTGGGNPSFGMTQSGSSTVRREVPKPTRQIQKPQSVSPKPPQEQSSASNMAGLHGSVSRAITGEEKPSVPEAHAIPDAVAYERAAEPGRSRAADFDSAVEAAQRAIREKGADSARAAAENVRTDGVPRAFRGTAAGREEAPAEKPASSGTVGKDRIFGGGYAPAERIEEQPARPSASVPERKDRGVAAPQSAQPVKEPEPAAPEASSVSAADAAKERSAVNPFASAGSQGSAAARKRVDEAIERGVPKEESVAFDSGSGPVIQQSMFAKQQMENIAKARAEAPPLASYERIAEERQKRVYSPREPRENKEKSLQKTENLAKKVAKEKGERMTQVNIDQAISQVTPKKPYVAPPVSLLLPPEKEVEQDEDYEKKKTAICNALEFFGVGAEVTEIKVGPTFSLYTCRVDMPKGKSVNTLQNYESDLAMKMEEKSVHILAPIPGMNAVGIEVPNKHRRKVRMSELLLSPAYNGAPTPTTCALGEDLYGTIYTSDIKEFPHILIAGTTGSGKSIFVHSIIMSMLFRASPDEVRFIMIDPKMVEFTKYEGIPHLMLDEIIFAADKAIRALNWAIAEMQRRIEYFAQLHFRDIDEYNRNCEQIGSEKMPRIVIIVDELADLMSTGKKAVEEAINRLARLARAAGIHLVLATQRPSVDVISGTIKNNLPTRIALTLSSIADSRTVIDAGGAEKLLGYGDLLYMTPKSSQLIRMQGALITDQEIKAVVDFIKDHNEAYFDQSVKDAIFKEEEEAPAEAPSGGKKAKDSGGLPPEVFKALRMGLDGSPITISGMQRKLSLGFPKAAKIFDIMVDMHLIAPSGDDKKNRVCVTEAEIDALEFGDGGGEGEDAE